MNESTLVSFGGSVKALGDGRVGGYLVRFSTANDPDLSATKDYFTAQTGFGLEDSASSAVYYAHCLDPQLKTRKIGRGTMKADDAGVWLEAQLSLRDEYEKHIYDLAQKGKLGWSSGTAAHLVTRKAVETPNGTAHEILTWPLGLDASLTPTPAEPRCDVVALKSLQDSLTPLGMDVPTENDIGDELSADIPATDGDDDETATTPIAMTGKQVDVAALKGLLRESMTYDDHASIAQDAMEGFATRTEGLLDLATKSGRLMSKARHTKLAQIHAGMTTAHAAMAAHLEAINSLLLSTDPDKAARDAKKDADEIAVLRMQHLRSQSRTLGIAV